MILIAFGTRPEWLKIKPLINKFISLDVKYLLLFTGQHLDLIKDIKVDYSILIEDGENRLDSIIQSTLNSINDEIWNRITHVLVQGDTTSVLGMALTAYHHQKKIIHLEAGLRTYNNDNPYPEEQNRRMVSQITDIHLCPTEKNKINLENELILGDKYIVGNTILDNLISYKDTVKYDNKVLITLHRRENHNIINKWFTEINNLAITYSNIEFLIPLHPNPNVVKYKDLLKNVKVVKPLSHDKLISYLTQCKLIITDSGGLQEECSFFNKKCLVCRKETERPEALNLSSFLIEDPNELEKMFKYHIKDPIININSPYGDGNSCEKIYQILKNKNII